MTQSNQYSFRIKRFRESLGLTQVQAAKILEMRERSYQAIENGERKIFRLWEVNGIEQTLKEFAHEFGK